MAEFYAEHKQAIEYQMRRCVIGDLFRIAFKEILEFNPNILQHPSNDRLYFGDFMIVSKDVYKPTAKTQTIIDDWNERHKNTDPARFKFP